MTHDIAGLLLPGITPNVMRNSIINAAELASYDQIKTSFQAAGMEAGPVA